MSAVVGPAAREDLPRILSLLGASGLPPDGLENRLGSALVARESGRVVGSATLELHGPTRSCAQLPWTGDIVGAGSGGV